MVDGLFLKGDEMALSISTGTGRTMRMVLVILWRILVDHLRGTLTRGEWLAGVWLVILTPGGH